MPRPLSPHLQIYKPQISSVLSILHRVTGVALAGGALLLIWWLLALAAGPESYGQVQAAAASWPGRVVLLGFTWALLFHTCNGVRHLAWDAGYGFDIAVMRRTGWAAVAASLLLTAVAWALAYAWRGGP